MCIIYDPGLIRICIFVSVWHRLFIFYGCSRKILTKGICLPLPLTFSIVELKTKPDGMKTEEDWQKAHLYSCSPPIDHKIENKTCFHKTLSQPLMNNGLTSTSPLMSHLHDPINSLSLFANSKYHIGQVEFKFQLKIWFNPPSQQKIYQIWSKSKAEKGARWPSG